MKEWEKIEPKKRNEYNLILNNNVHIITSTKNLCKMTEARIEWSNGCYLYWDKMSDRHIWKITEPLDEVDIKPFINNPHQPPFTP